MERAEREQMHRARQRLCPWRQWANKKHKKRDNPSRAQDYFRLSNGIIVTPWPTDLKNKIYEMEWYALSLECAASSPENNKRKGLKISRPLGSTGQWLCPTCLLFFPGRQLSSPISAWEPCGEQEEKPSPCSPEIYYLSGRHGPQAGSSESLQTLRQQRETSTELESSALSLHDCEVNEPWGTLAFL